MTIEATDAKSLASMHASAPEFLSGFADSKEHSDISGNQTAIDLSQTVYTSQHGNCYHDVRSGLVSACPNNNVEQSTLRSAAADGNVPCKVCKPPDYRDATALLGKLTPEGAQVVCVKLSDETQAIFLQQESETEPYQAMRRIESKSSSNEKQCDRVTVLSLLDTLVNADGFQGIEYGSVEEIWPYSEGGDCR